MQNTITEKPLTISKLLNYKITFIDKLPDYQITSFLLNYLITKLPLGIKEMVNMFRCDCYPNHEICKNKNTCEFWVPLNQKLDQLYRQISYELYQLERLHQRKQDYFTIQSEIKKGVYTETINVDGKIKTVPKKNALGEDILKPEHVQVGLDYDLIFQEIIDTESIIRELRRIENDILKILKKKS